MQYFSFAFSQSLFVWLNAMWNICPLTKTKRVHWIWWKERAAPWEQKPNKLSEKQGNGKTHLMALSSRAWRTPRALTEAHGQSWAMWQQQAAGLWVCCLCHRYVAAATGISSQALPDDELLILLICNTQSQSHPDFYVMTRDGFVFLIPTYCHSAFWSWCSPWRQAQACTFSGITQ